MGSIVAGRHRRHRRAVPWLVLPVAALCAPLVASAASGQARTVRAEIGGTVLAVAVPDGFVATLRPGSIVLVPDGADTRRRLVRMELGVGGGASPVPLDRLHGTGANAVRYGVARDTVGSGGEEVTLVAERPCARATIRLRLDVQGDASTDPGFGPAFALLARVRYFPAG